MEWISVDERLPDTCPVKIKRHWKDQDFEDSLVRMSPSTLKDVRFYRIWGITHWKPSHEPAEGGIALGQ